MKLLKNNTHIHGFEDYKILRLHEGCFTWNCDFTVPYHFLDSTDVYIISENLPVKVSNRNDLKYDWLKTVTFTPTLCENHKELLSEAKKVYVHHNCKLSRSLMAEKYKKCLNPWLADVVVVPNINYDDLRLSKFALFMCEADKVIVAVPLDGEEAIKKFDNYIVGTQFRNFATGNPNYNGYNTWTNSDVSYDNCHIMDSELFYVGEVLTVPNSCSFVADILTNIIPRDRIVYENSVMESLSNETNQLSLDNLISIKDMLESSDDNTVSAGLKSLSLMDWIHYPNSVKFVLRAVENKWNWVYNKACGSTSVKYMIKSLAPNISSRGRWPGDYDYTIYEEDYNLFKQLKLHFDKCPEDKLLEYMRYLNFMTVTPAGMIAPNYKKRD